MTNTFHKVKVNIAGVEAYPSGRAQPFAGGLPIVYVLQVKVNIAGVEAYPSGRAQPFAGGLPIGNNVPAIQMNELSLFPTFSLIPSRHLRGAS
ncbi:hypothetical protein C2G38_2203129 [Gigaspora rosea]|uniref:Uncharacterized protein n=1 Tax=Gigaspora rosea TaxID=44941 RepID=A0A397UPT6_9GLOM|nr:hypothetical protein C2G38_2203129 [Gigaspora rosea]